MRGLGAFLPERLRLVDDPYGLRFARGARALRDWPGAERRGRWTAPLWMRGYLRRFAVYMQLRTRVIDDDVAAFATAGGRQLVLLGAGFDCRAWRLAALAGATVYEVDHPATQAKKRAIMSGEPTPARVVFVPWDFEHQPLSELPARLKAEGHDNRAPTMTILEGVVMYLTEPALDTTFACIASYSARGSPLAMTYMDRELIDRRFEGLRGPARRRPPLRRALSLRLQSRRASRVAARPRLPARPRRVGAGDGHAPHGTHPFARKSAPHDVESLRARATRVHRYLVSFTYDLERGARPRALAPPTASSRAPPPGPPPRPAPGTRIARGFP